MFSGGDIHQSYDQKSPSQSQGIELDSEHGNKTDSDDKVAVKLDEPSDRAALYGQHLINEMRQMSKRRFKLFRKEVEASVAKYSSSPDSDDNFTPPYKKRNTETTNATLSSSSRLTSNSCGYAKYIWIH
ncbi:hypothetical protein DPMN_113280 [Dreissena polymorpha]|uniref:Uncharacterized protein n=1 Tax=Dreissena polymorpha TaxID=45954 RepID=A0A9D4KH92_DREPO|nr:hypothetical protein DPMN_113280 [Dreissena polymorpha]